LKIPTASAVGQRKQVLPARVYVKSNARRYSDNVPKTHNISYIVRAFEDKLSEPVTDKRYDLFDDLRAFYINGRYTDFKQKMSAGMNEQGAKNFLDRTKEAFAWLLTLKPSIKP
jgi:HEPN domain-containing protein